MFIVADLVSLTKKNLVTLCVQISSDIIQSDVVLHLQVHLYLQDDHNPILARTW